MSPNSGQIIAEETSVDYAIKNWFEIQLSITPPNKTEDVGETEDGNS